MRPLVAALILLSLHLRADTVQLVAGSLDSKGAPTGIVTPFGLGFGPYGEIYFSEMNGNRVRRVTPDGTVENIAGSLTKGDSGDGGPAAAALLNGPHHLLVLPDGRILVADTWNNRIRVIDPITHRISPFAGTGKHGFSGDGGPALNAQFGGVFCLALDPRAQKLYIADLDNRRIRAIDLRTNIVNTVAGNGTRGIPPDGAQAAAAPLFDPRAVAVDSKGNIYILERGGHALRVVDPKGIIHTVAGTGKPGLSGDGGPARQATLRGPKHLCIDKDDNVIIADTDNHVIRKYTPRDGKISRIAGTGVQGKAGDSGIGASPLSLELNQPHGVAIDPSGILYIADSFNNRILKLAP